MDFCVGVLALHGSFAEHISCLQSLNINCCEVRSAKDGLKCDAFIFPGGESTTIWSLLGDSLKACLLDKYKQGAAIWGVCAGSILCSNEYLNLIDVNVARNAYGRQIASDVVAVSGVNCQLSLGSVILIRAPKFVWWGGSVAPLVKDNSDNILLLANQRCLISSFHPELLTNNIFNWHLWFVKKAMDLNSNFQSLV